MPRKPRIQYPGAVYHVMNRGDRGGRIFRDLVDYDLFMVAMDEVCQRCGWRLHAYALLPNHFHWLLETPAPNLVAGMKWFLGAYSQRFNARHGQRGHVFQGRYKALPIDADSGGYFERVSTYIHLNPARAGLLKEEGLRGYRWSSYRAYVTGKKTRPKWLRVRRVLGNLDLRDDTKGRKAYGQYLESRAGDLRTKAGRKAFKEEWKTIRYGWYLGDEGFKDKLLKGIGKVVEGRQRASYSGESIRQHDEYEAEGLLRAGMSVLKIKEADLEALPKGDETKCVLAWLVHSQTMASHQWISERLRMGVPSNMTKYVEDVKQPISNRIAKIKRNIEKHLIPK